MNRRAGLLAVLTALSLVSGFGLAAQSSPRREVVAVVPQGSYMVVNGFYPHSLGVQVEVSPWDPVAFWVSGSRLGYQMTCTLGPCYGPAWNGSVGATLRLDGSRPGLSAYLGAGIGHSRFDGAGATEHPWVALLGFGWRNSRYVTPRLELRVEHGSIMRVGSLLLGFAIGFPRPPLPTSPGG